MALIHINFLSFEISLIENRTPKALKSWKVLAKRKDLKGFFKGF